MRNSSLCSVTLGVPSGNDMLMSRPADGRPSLPFARRFLRSMTMSSPGLTPTQLQACIKLKKPSTSAGLDGISLVDLKSLPVSGLKNVCDMFRCAEQHGTWPTQVLAGRVTSSAKVEFPSEPMDFRPIAVLGLLYRCWGTHHARCFIRQLGALLPVGLYVASLSHV